MAPKKEEVPPHLNFAPLENAVESSRAAPPNIRKRWSSANANGGAALAAASLRDVNALLIESERKLTTPEGIPGRSWYKHELYAPGEYTGYAVKAIPAVREAMEQKHWKLAERRHRRVAQVLKTKPR